MQDTKDEILRDAIECAIRADKNTKYYRRMLHICATINAGFVIAGILYLITG